MPEELHRFTTSGRAHLVKLPEPSPELVERWNLHGDLDGVVFDPNPGCVTLSFGADGPIRVVRS